MEVNPNGSFLAWLPVPERSAGDTARYRLVARVGGEVDSLEHSVRLPPRPYEGEGSVWVDTAALSGLAERWGPPDAVMEHTVRAAPGLEARVEVRPPVGRAGAGPPSADALAAELALRDPVPAVRFPLEETSPGRYRLRVELGRLARAAGAPADSAVDGGRPPSEGCAPRRPRDGTEGAGTHPRTLPGGAAPVWIELTATDGRDTATAGGGTAVLVLDPRRPPTGTIAEEPDPVHGAAGAVPGRPSPRGSYAWRLPPGSAAPVDRRVGDRIRLRLGPDLHAWVAAEDLRVGPPEELRADRAAPTAAVGRVSADPRDDRVRVRVPVGRRLPAHAEPAGPRSLRLVVHGGLGATERMLYGPDDPLLRGLRWSQEPGPRWTLTVRLAEPVWGWDLGWGDVGSHAGRAPAERRDDVGGPAAAGPDDDARRERPLPAPGEPGTLVLDVHRPPEIDGGDPLRGVRVAVDPGHPPVGAEGPTGLTEAEANLGVARELARLLEEAGAEPVLVRDTDAAVGLYERRDSARAAGADLLVSIHNNALPDGLRPFGREGTSTYYFHPHARRLARQVQRGMLRTMGLRDRGVRWGNLALPRESWMPTVLTEGAFMMIPRHEAALRTQGFREAYARGVLEGLRGFLQSHAAR